MFTGIVEDFGEVEAVEHLGDFARIHVRSSVVTQDARPGDSICVSGVCLTVTSLIGSQPAPRGFAADVGREVMSPVTVRQTPFTQMESPTRASSVTTVLRT